MNLTQWILTTATSTALAGGLLGLIGYFIKDSVLRRLQLQYDKDLENHKANLKRDYDVQVETLKANLKGNYDVQIETLKAELSKNQFRFSHIFEKTAETIIKSHQLLLELQDAVSLNLGLAGRTDDKANKHREELSAKRTELYRYLLTHKIYLPLATTQKIDAFAKKVFGIHLTYDTYLRMALRTPDTKEKIDAAVDSMYKEVPIMLENLEADFQKILGFEEAKKG